MSEWYRKLNKAPWTPPDWVFGVVWSILYLLMGISFFLVWTNKKCYPYCNPLLYFLVQLGFNLMWTTLFFEYKKPEWAMFDLILTYVFTIYTYVEFKTISNAASLLLLPYLAWLTLAFTLNAYVVLYN
jgi:translocator protein